MEIRCWNGRLRCMFSLNISTPSCCSAIKLQAEMNFEQIYTFALYIRIYAINQIYLKLTIKIKKCKQKPSSQLWSITILFRFPLPFETVLPRGRLDFGRSDNCFTFHACLDSEKVESCHLTKQIPSLKQRGAMHSRHLPNCIVHFLVSNFTIGTLCTFFHGDMLVF